MKDNNQKLAYLAAMGQTIITGLSFMFLKIGLNVSNPWDLLAYRFTASFLPILILVLLKWVKLDLNREKIIKVLPLAIFYPLLFFAFQTFGLQYMPSSEAAILFAMMPIFTLILASFFLNEETSLLQKLSIMLSVAGVIYITLKNGSTFEFKNAIGTSLILVSALSFSIYSIMVKKLTKDFSIMEMTYMMIIISFIFFNAMSVGTHILNGTIRDFFAPLHQLKFILSVVYLGVLSSLVTSLVTNYALSKMDASKMCVFTNLGTVISIIAGVVFLNEKIYYYHIIGSILIISGVVGTNCLHKRNKNI